MESLGNAPRKPACKASSQPSARPLGDTLGARPGGLEPTFASFGGSLAALARSYIYLSDVAPHAGFDPASLARQASRDTSRVMGQSGGRGGRNRTDFLLCPKQAPYQSASPRVASSTPGRASHAGKAKPRTRTMASSPGLESNEALSVFSGALSPEQLPRGTAHGFRSRLVGLKDRRPHQKSSAA